jgi:hypothetical protein
VGKYMGRRAWLACAKVTRSVANAPKTDSGRRAVSGRAVNGLELRQPVRD